jgi:cytochrome c-type biogenesis protein CcmH/NrfG
MKRSESTARSWRHAQICGIAVLCLLLGIGIWHFTRGPFAASAINPGVVEPASVRSLDAKITIDQLKQAADRQAEPLLAQLRKSPDDPFLLAEIGKVYFQMHQFSMAAKYYEDSIRLKPDATVLVKLGGAHHFGGDDDKAIDAWNQALHLDPNNPDALFNIGFVKWRVQGDRKAAISAWQKLLKTNPDHPKRALVEELLAKAKQRPETPMAGKE